VYQLELAARHGYRGDLQRRGEQLVTHLDQFFLATNPRRLFCMVIYGQETMGLMRRVQPFVFDPVSLLW